MSPEFVSGRGHGHTLMMQYELVNTSALRPPHATQHSGDSPLIDMPDGHLTPAELFVRAQSSVVLRMFHCKRVRKMPLSGLDPSILMGFRGTLFLLVLISSSASPYALAIFFLPALDVVLLRLPRTFFGIQDEPPTRPSADDDAEMGLERISNPEEVEDAGVEDGDVSTASHAVSNSSYFHFAFGTHIPHSGAARMSACSRGGIIFTAFYVDLATTVY
ncbi:hypothetical protein DFH07DRAFT_969128 [Mycena maculata]|uniref:Uncharacterized protein n=1 Tax=Mycena maculata TaxID=230809 RepID=A0AAD7HYK8_9AGAR|nr:hypothetical protein DFH07DRAFT_969128 [Mycena maculata]